MTTAMRNIVLASVMGVVATSAQAGEVEINADASVVSNYVFRGISRNGSDPAIQANVDFGWKNGTYAGVFASTMGGVDVPDFEAMAYAGYLLNRGVYDFNFQVQYDSFHSNDDSSGYVEFMTSASRDFGIAYTTLGVSYAPDNRDIGLGRSIYTFGSADVNVPITGGPAITLGLKLGYEDFEGGFDKWDWSAGIYGEKNDFELGLIYKDTNVSGIKGAGAGVFLSLKAFF
ncbi:MAG: TorF family putative porin [Sphingomonadales bacterium]|nr:TorF family putative porin [Sphingomonadales bacterium]